MNAASSIRTGRNRRLKPSKWISWRIDFSRSFSPLSRDLDLNDDILPVVKHDSPHSHDSRSDFPDLLDQNESQSQARALARKGIVRMYGDVQNAHFGGGHAQISDQADRGIFIGTAVEGEQRLG